MVNQQFKKIKGTIQKHSPIVLGLLSFIISLIFGIDSRDVPNVNDLLGAAVNIGAISVGFLISVVTVLIATKDHPNIRYLAELNYNSEKNYLDVFVEFLKHSIASSFIFSIISAICLMFDQKEVECVYLFIFKLWILVSIVFICSLGRIIRILSDILSDMFQK